METSKTNKDLFIVIILSSLMAFASLSTDFYLPALPQISAQLDGNAELSLGAFLLGYAIGQLLWGGISDRLGRRIPLFIGVLIFFIASMLCAESSNIQELILWRFVQSIGASCAPVSARAIVRDLYDKKMAASIFSTLTMVMTATPIIAPLFGGWIASTWTWNVIFVLLAFIGFVIFLSVCFLPESLPKEKRSDISVKKSLSIYKDLVLNFSFVKYAFSLGFYYTAIFVFIVASPYIYINDFGIAQKHYGYLFAINILGVIILSYANKHMVHKLNMNLMLKISLLIVFLTSLLLAIGTAKNFAGLFFIVFCIFIIFSLNGIIGACTNALALHQIPQENAGTAAAIIGALQYIGGVFASMILSVFGHSAKVMAISICFFAFLAIIFILINPNFKKAKE